MSMKSGTPDREGDKSYEHKDEYPSSNYRFVKVTFNSSKNRNIKIEFLGALEALYTENKYDIKLIDKVNNRKTILFLGDSWTYGATSDDSGASYGIAYRGYPSVIANNLDMNVINLGVGNSGYTTRIEAEDYTNYMQRIQYVFENWKSVNPDIIVICSSGNDSIDVAYHPDQKTNEEVAQAADACYKYVKQEKPNAKVIVLGPEYATGGQYTYSKNLDKLNPELKKTAQENKLPYVDFLNGEVLDGDGNKVREGTGPVIDGNYLSPDGVHLRFEGYKFVGEFLTPIISELINK